MTVTDLAPASAPEQMAFPVAAAVSNEPRQLRGYQIQAADAVCDAYNRGVTGPAVVLPTGTGKSSVIAELARREVTVGGRVLLMAHRDELIKQMAQAVTAVNPAGPLPSLIGGGNRDDPTAQIVSATVQSLQTEAALARIGHRDIVIVDEAHHAPARTYRKVLDHFTALGARRAGFTATMIRHAPNKNEPALRTIWEEVVFERDIPWAIENGFLIAPVGVTVELPELDVSALKAGSGGDISDEVAEEAMMRETTLNATVEAVLTRTEGRSSIVFGASLLHCEQLAKSLVEQGVSAEVVVGDTKTKVRNGIYNRFRHGTTQVLVTVDVLTEGADFPRCEAVVLARPTRSQSRLVQCVGRALRPHTFEDGTVKDTALVVDLVGAGSLGLMVKTRLDPEHRDKTDEDEEGFGCYCQQPCTSDECDFSCTGIGCECNCTCASEPSESGPASDPASSVPCTCACSLAFGLCRCGCECDLHRIDPLRTFDPVTGEMTAAGKQRRGDSSWSQRTSTIRWVRHSRGMVRTVYRSNGHKGVLLLADMRGVAGTVAGRDWAFGFLDNSVHRMYWVGIDGQWTEPGPRCHLQGLTLFEADALAQSIFADHMRDSTRSEPSTAQVDFAAQLGVPDAGALDRRDLSDMIALAQAEYWLPTFTRPESAVGTAA
ncbi:DEAD/DEAH box helicase [Mycobacteroides abscessus]|uniref:DEAD/DEAH box helicase n=1 Tax=Mycobacteroides abscessus TaxID=36809 RepID=UPI0005DFACD6|nr:DEAD/DEAH box helicase [Mycobacteroides abscessus]CPW92229.1 type III restriction enzyme res subunit [Mycobacteroides abscessus]SKF42470.1 type III restriction enzyme res subunit [Mycobacteroides abscessus subsp. bolletii]SKH17847.1 type III restriction enzyme res subunit [Mycobacteroides abscessus subsp. bolletii]